MKTNAQSAYAEQVATQIIEAIENGTAPWMKEWSGFEAYKSAPINAKTDNHYNGMNSINLMIKAEQSGYADSRWMTYKQADEMGYQVKKGEKGTKIEYWKLGEHKDKLDENGKLMYDENGDKMQTYIQYKRPRVYQATVFNAQQVDGISRYEDYTPPAMKFEPNELAETILKNSGADIRHEAQAKAYYQPAGDFIVLPTKEQFETQAGYYATALHELGHWTGHESRLDRDMSGIFGTEMYAKEELRAEISSFMLSSRLGIDFNPNYPNNHFAYIENWVELIKDKPSEIFKATSDAEKIAGYIEGLSIKKELEQINEDQTKYAVFDPISLVTVLTANTIQELHDKYINTYAEHDDEDANVLVYSLKQKNNGKWEANTKIDVDWNKIEQYLEKQTYLYVPYSEKEQAKAFGCQYDVENKAWYAPSGTDENSIKEWLPANQTSKYTPPSTTESKENPIISFRDEMLKRGWKLQGEPIANGKFHRVKTAEDKSGQKSGSYAIHNDGVPMLILTDFKQGTQENIRIDTNYIPTEADKKVFATLNEISRIKQLQNNIDTKETQAEVSQKITKEFSNMEHSSQLKNHPYLASKGLMAGYTTKQDKDGNLVIPFGKFDDGKFSTLQRIHENADGTFTKMWEKGGEKQGNFHFIPGGLGSSKGILVCEGYSTGLSLNVATDMAVVVTGDAGNIKSVMETIVEYQILEASIKDTNPPNIIIAADNDLHRGVENNTGVIKAREAMSYIIEKYPHMEDKITVAVPSFNSEEIKNKATDFNDLHQSRGTEVVKNQIDISILRLQQTEVVKSQNRQMERAKITKEKAQEKPQEKVQSKGVER